MKKLTLIGASAALMFAACSEPLQEAAEINNLEIATDVNHSSNPQKTIYTNSLHVDK